jgi:hypothetical protein
MGFVGFVCLEKKENWGKLSIVLVMQMLGGIG